MHQLGDQWVEIIDGQEHVVKAVETVRAGYCKSCVFVGINGNRCRKSIKPCHEEDIIIKDLGILRDGLLPCPFCGEYTEILKGKLRYRIRHVCRDSYVMAGTGIYETKQQAIDAWNRRA